MKNLKLPNRLLRVSRHLESKFNQIQPSQIGDLAHAYHVGLQLAPDFSEQVEVFTALENHNDLSEVEGVALALETQCAVRASRQ